MAHGRVAEQPRWLLPRPITWTLAVVPVVLGGWLLVVGEPHEWRNHLMVPVVAGGLAVVGRWPRYSWFALVPALLSPLWGDASGVNLLALILLAPAVMAASDRVLLTVTVLTLTVWAIARGVVTTLRDGITSSASVLLCVFAVMLGLTARHLSEGWRASEVEVVDLEARTLKARADQRRQLAQEMHDRVADRIAGISRRSQAALDEGDDGLAAALDAVEDDARIALKELRTLLGVLRDQSGPEKSGAS